jgi:hypothetical protein
MFCYNKMNDESIEKSDKAKFTFEVKEILIY